MKKHYRHETDCLNCGTDLQGNFCHKCGQENLEMKESFGHMLNHAVSDYFHFDYQFFHTLKPLFAKPGKLTVDYLAGRRMQYLHPVKMYIFISLVFFVVFFKQNGKDLVKVTDSKEKGSATISPLKAKMLEGIEKDTTLTPAEKEKAKQAIGYISGSVADHDSTKITKKTVNGKPVYYTDDPEEVAKGNFNFIGDKDSSKTYDEYLKNQIKHPENERDGLILRYIKKKSYDWKSQGKNAPEILVEGLKHNAPKMMFVLLPLFALILKIAFWKNHKLYVEHIIYSIHLHCFIFLFLTFTIIIGMILPHSWSNVMDWIGFITTMVIIWYIYRSFRVVYNRSRWRTVTKMLGVSLMYGLATGLCFFVFIVITMLTSV